MGNLDWASELFHKGLSIPTAPMYLTKPQLLVGLALIALRRQLMDEALRWMTEARQYVHERRMKNLYPLVAMAEAQLSAANGEVVRALVTFEEGEAVAIGMGMRPMVWKFRLAAAQLLEALGRADEARQKKDEARATIDEIAGLFTDEELRGRFVKSATSKLD
jgi:hypothetical protein